jgi:uncharacterized protein YdaU (DUF1376 family)
VNFYKHYIGDFQRDTGHLSLTERGAYRAMLDHYYATERPLPKDKTAVARLVGAMDASERAAVQRVLSEFWIDTPDGWANERADREIAKAAAQRDINREIGKRGGRPPKNRTAPVVRTESVSDSVLDSVSDSEPNRNPNQTPDKYIPPSAGETPSKTDPTDTADDANEDATKRLFDLGVDVLTSAGHTERAARAFIGKVRQSIGDERAIGVLLAAQKTTDPAGYVTKAVRRETTKRVQLC